MSLLGIFRIQDCHADVIKWKQILRYWSFVRGIHRSPVNSPHKGQWRGALMFPLICGLNKRLSKQAWCWWFETPPDSLWRHCNSILDWCFYPTSLKSHKWWVMPYLFAWHDIILVNFQIICTNHFYTIQIIGMPEWQVSAMHFLKFETSICIIHIPRAMVIYLQHHYHTTSW